MAKKNKVDTLENNEIKDIIKFNYKKSIKERFFALYEANRNLNKTKIANELSISRVTLNKWVKEYESTRLSK